MKRILVAALALTTAASALAAPTFAAAQPGRDIREARRDIRESRQDIRQAKQERRWRQGQRLDRRYGAYQPVNDWRARRLPAPRRGYHWVRQGNDYVLAALAGGLIASVIAANN